MKQPLDDRKLVAGSRRVHDALREKGRGKMGEEELQDGEEAAGSDGLKGNRIESLFAKTLDKPLEERERAGEGGGGDKMVRMEDDLKDFFRVGVPQGGEDVQVTVEGGLEGTERGAGFGTVTEPPKDDGEVAVF